MEAIIFLLSGITIALYTEEVPKIAKTIIWIALVIIGIVKGALTYFTLG